MYGAHIKPSNDVNLQERMGCFATQTFTKSEIFRLYRGTLIYKTMLDAVNPREVCRECEMVATRKWFDASATQLTEQVSSSEVEYHIMPGSNYIFFFQFVESLVILRIK